ncbi:MAG: LysR family transcriptional regulator [Pseudomonadota bacterium]
MTDLSNSELRRLDLTLLLIFLGLLRHRKAAAVAQDLGLTQSAISQALRRLRDVFGDELFLRRPHGMEPTATALALEAPVAEAVNALRGALGATRSFDPATASGVVRVAALHTEQAVLIPRLFARLRSFAPGLTLSILPAGRREAAQALRDDRADVALGFFRDIPDNCSAQLLYSETYLVAGRPDVLTEAPDISLDAYCAADHLLTAPGGGNKGIVDDHLAGIGRERRVLLSLPAFLPALAATVESGALLTLPSRVALRFAEPFGLVTARPPLELPSFPVSVLWHRRNETDPKTRWLKTQLVPS